MASEIRVDKINSLSGVGTVTLSPTGVDIAGITTAATLRATTGIVTSLTAGSLTSLGAVSGTTGTFSGAVSGTTGTFSAAVSGTTGTFSGAVSGTTGTFSGVIKVPDGSTSAPSITAASDTNSGLYFATADALGLVVGGSRKLLANSSGITINNGDLTIDDKIIHAGDTNTAIRFPAADTVSVETAGSERFRFASDGVIHVNSSDSASGGRIWANSSALYLQSGNGRQTIKVSDASAGVNRTIEMTSAGNLAFPSGNGIDFSATSDAGGMASELLDDYEEGTFTPRLGPNLSMSTIHENGVGRYTKVGNMVTCTMHWIAKDGTAFPTNQTIRIDSLPYTIIHVGNTTSAHYVAMSQMMYKIQFGQQDKHYFYSSHNTTYLTGLKSRDGTSWQDWSTSDWNQSDIYLNTSITYMTTS